MKICFYTSINNAYFSKARALARSIKTVYPDAHFVLGLLDERVPGQENIEEAIDEFFDVREHFPGEFRSWIFKHTVVEACTAQKGLIARVLIERALYDAVVYLDPDIFVYSRMLELEQALAECSIVLTPHLEVPAKSDESILANEFSVLVHGVYNLGFLALRADENGLKFANWWDSRLQQFCFDDKSRGLFTDQKWVDMAPGLFEGVSVMRHPGYNFATWNMENRHLFRNANGELQVGDQPLRFIHFSGFDAGMHAHVMSLRGSSQQVFAELSRRYESDLIQLAVEPIDECPWVYGFNYQGERIEPWWRRRYRDSLVLQTRFDDPFTIPSEAFSAQHFVDPLTQLVVSKNLGVHGSLELLGACSEPARATTGALEGFQSIRSRLMRIVGADRRLLLFINHGLGGGAELHSLDLSRFLGEGFAIVEVSAHAENLIEADVSIRVYIDGVGPIEVLKARWACSELMNLIRDPAFLLVHVHHILRAEDLWLSLLVESGVDYKITIHDYYLLNQNWAMARRGGGLMDLTEHALLLSEDRRLNPQRREKVLRLLLQASEVIFPSRDCMSRFTAEVELPNAVLAAHPETPRPESVGLLSPRHGSVVNVAVIGDMNLHKGSKEVELLARRVIQEKLPYRIHLFGADHWPLRGLVKFHGSFIRNELPFLLNRMEIDVVWLASRVHETYGYVLSDVMKAGLPVVASSVGSFPERLSGRPRSILVSTQFEATEVLQATRKVLESLGEPSDFPDTSYANNFYYDQYKKNLEQM